MPLETAPPLYFDPPPDFLNRNQALMSIAHNLEFGFTHDQVTNDKPLQSFGMALWDALKPWDHFNQALENANAKVLPLVVRSDKEEVQRLPWECLFHPRFGFLARDTRFTLSRARTGAQNLEPAPAGPFKVLVFNANPKDLGPACRDVGAQQDAIYNALEPLVLQNRAHLVYSPDSHFETFCDMVKDQYHIVFLSGRGYYNNSLGLKCARFYFDHGGGVPHAVGSQKLADALSGGNTRCLVLSAFRIGQQTSSDLANGLAGDLWDSGVANVVAMRECVVDEAANRFDAELCRMLASGNRLDAAVQSARRVMSAPLRSHPGRPNPNHDPCTMGQWSLPICYSADAHMPLMDWELGGEPLPFA